MIDAAGARPLAVGDLPPQCAALNRAFLNVVDLTVRAGVEQRADRVRQALLVDPATSATLSPERIDDLAEAMLAAHAQWLPPGLRPAG